MDKCYSFDEICLIPKAQSKINSKKDTNPFIDGKLPIFVAPMTCIIDKKNWGTFLNSRVIPIYPVWYNETPDFSHGWVAVTLKTFKEYFVEQSKNLDPDDEYNVLIDCAQGQMESLYEMTSEAKKTFKNLKVMIGNIANPGSYVECCKHGVDFVRIGIGGGSGCTTAVETGFHTSIPWMLYKINFYRNLPYVKEKIYSGEYTETKVIADGGINTVAKFIKSLALGADYVMMGKMFSQCVEACGEIKTEFDKDSNSIDKRHYYGQSSIYGQMDRFGKIKSLPEGTDLWVPITSDLSITERTLEERLRSAMSYAGAFTLNDFIGKVDYEIQTISEFNSYNK